MGLTSYARDADPRGVLIKVAPAALPQTATVTYFTVVGGEVEITDLYGVVETTIQAQADALKFRHTPTGGTVADITGTVDVNGGDAGSIVQFHAPTDAGALSQAGTDMDLTGGVGGTLGYGGVIVVGAGNIGLNAAASNTGAITWYLRYKPKRKGAYVKAAI